MRGTWGERKTGQPLEQLQEENADEWARARGLGERTFLGSSGTRSSGHAGKLVSLPRLPPCPSVTNTLMEKRLEISGLVLVSAAGASGESTVVVKWVFGWQHWFQSWLYHLLCSPLTSLSLISETGGTASPSQGCQDARRWHGTLPGIRWVRKALSQKPMPPFGLGKWDLLNDCAWFQQHKSIAKERLHNDLPPSGYFRSEK